MTKGELVELLQDYPDDWIIVLGSDAEGNSYSPLASVDDATYRPENTWSGDLVDDNDDAVEGDVDAIVLWPTN